MVHGEGHMGGGDERRDGRRRGATHGGSRVLHGGSCVKDRRKRQRSCPVAFSHLLPGMRPVCFMLFSGDLTDH